MKNELTASEKLAQWMNLMQLNDRQVGEAVGVDTAYIWRMRNGKMPVADSFAWKFAQVYGYDMATKLFGSKRVPA